MRRTQIYLEEALDQRLRAAAAREGRSAAALIRDAVRRYLAEQGSEAESDPFLQIAGRARGKHPDASVEHDTYLYGSDT